MKKIKVLHVLVSGTYNGAENVVCQIVDLFKSEDNFEMVYCSLDGPVRIALEERKIDFHPVKELTVGEIVTIQRLVYLTINSISHLANEL